MLMILGLTLCVCLVCEKMFKRVQLAVRCRSLASDFHRLHHTFIEIFFCSWPSQIIEHILWSPSSILGNWHSWFKFAEFLASCWYYVQGWRRGQYWQEHANAWLQLHVILELGTDGSTLKQYEREQGYWPSKYCSGLTHIPSTKVLGANKRWRQIYLLCVKMPHLNW